MVPFASSSARTLVATAVVVFAFVAVATVVPNVPVGASARSTAAPDVGAPAAAGDITTYRSTVQQPAYIAAGVNDDLWIANTERSSLTRMTTAGAATTYEDPAINRPTGIVVAGNGDVWFANPGSDTLGRRTAAGVLETFAIPSETNDVAIGVDGDIWFTMPAINTIARWNPDATVHAVYPVSVPQPLRISPGPEGAMAFSGLNGWVARITDQGVVTSTKIQPMVFVADLTYAADGAIWATGRGFAMRDTYVGRWDPVAGTRTTVPAGRKYPGSIISGPDGNVWYDYGEAAGFLARMTLAGVRTEIGVPFLDARELVAGPDGRVWFTAPGVVAHVDVDGGGFTRHPGIHQPEDILRGVDGNLWFSSPGSAAIGNATPTGAVDVVAPPPVSGKQVYDMGQMAAMPNGDLCGPPSTPSRSVAGRQLVPSRSSTPVADRWTSRSARTGTSGSRWQANPGSSSERRAVRSRASPSRRASRRDGSLRDPTGRCGSRSGAPRTACPSRSPRSPPPACTRRSLVPEP